MNKIIQSKRKVIACCAIFMVAITVFFVSLGRSYAQILGDVILDRGNVEEQVLYLSDIPYMKAQVGWGNVALDKTQSNTSLILVLNGSSTVFKKGIWAHATSTVEYDVSEYKDEYPYFTTYYGVNTTGNKGNGVKFYIYTSVDGKEWKLETEENPSALVYTNNAGFAKIDIRDVNYIRLYAHDNGSNASDHAVWADSKLIKEGYSDQVMLSVEEFDAYIKKRYSSGAIKDDLKLTLLQRNFINRVGQFQLRSFVDSDPKNMETLEWFIHNEEALRLWTMGGIPNGTYERALQVLSNLYHAHKEDLENENETPNGNKYKDLYLRMMLSLSLTHSSSIGLWIGGNQLSDAVTRYEIYKNMHLNNQLYSSSMFERMTVEEMRWLMHVNIDDEEIMWLHDYSLKKYPNVTERFNPYKYITYRTGYSYYRPQYYSQANYAKWDQKYELSKYNITYQSGKPKLWIVFEEGSVCGGLSKTAANLYGVWGVPASVVGQPAHAAYIYYYEVGGKGAWQLAYNVAATGWANTQGYSRMPNDWGNFSSGVVTNTGSIKSASYFFLAQEAQNEYDKYENAEFILLLESVYKNDKDKLERIYRDALNEEIINWDAWLGLVNLYIKDTTKTEADLVDLAEEISNVLTYHPLPMYDLTRRLGTKITSPQYKGKLMLIQEKTLRQATKATASNTLQYKEVPVVAQALLGEISAELATFSFDGANAGKIILSRQLQSTQVNWSYSLDGGTTWTDVFEHYVQLTPEQIASIDINKDIKIHISGLDYSAANIYTINITKRSFPSGVITINDEEDKMFGATSDMEWSLNPSEGWNSFANTNPIFSGNVRVYVRVTATGTQIASDPVYFTFKENNVDDSKWYIQSKNIKAIEVNATQSGNMNNVLDGNTKTYWRSKDGVLPAYMMFELDQPRYISGIDYVPDPSAKYLTFVPYGRARTLNIYVSMDRENWELAGTKTNLGDNDNLKHIDLPVPKKAKYVKIECVSAYDSEIISFTVSVLKFYENVAVSDTPRADVNYNIVRKTNQNVVAELVNPTRDITVTNNGGSSSYTFTENGEFTFEYEDADGNKGSTTARVDWIDKTPPKLTVAFSTTSLTNGDVVATLTFDKTVTILSKDVEIAENPTDKSKTITFLENGSFELKFEDELGNVGSKVITVDWIDKVHPTGEIDYSITTLTDKPVTVTLVPSEPITVTNNDGKLTYTFEDNGEFTFEFIDRVGNTGSATARVDWITSLPEYTIEYSTEELTNEDVDVTVEIEDGYRIVNNDAHNVYTFEENGEFDFQYVDSRGAVGLIHTAVTWIDKTPPTAELKYVKEKDKVTVTVVNPSEEITYKKGNGVYTYTENGEYEIIIVDKVGNEGKLIAIVDSLGKDDDDKPGTTDPNPDKPGEDDKPSKPDPDEPGEDDKPGTDEPDDSDGDDKPGTTDPKPDEPSKPNTDKPTNPSKPGTSDKPNESEKPSDTDYKSYPLGNLSVEIPSNAIKVEGTVKSESFGLSDQLKGKFGEASEYYDVFFADKKNGRVDIASSDPIKISISIDKSKKLLGVYEITSDGLVKKIDYKVDGKNIELSTKSLGKFVVSYDEVKEEIPKEDESETKDEQKKGNTTILFVMLCCIGIAVGLTILFLKKKQNL